MVTCILREQNVFLVEVVFGVFFGQGGMLTQRPLPPWCPHFQRKCCKIAVLDALWEIKHDKVPV